MEVDFEDPEFCGFWLYSLYFCILTWTWVQEILIKMANIKQLSCMGMGSKK